MNISFEVTLTSPGTQTISVDYKTVSRTAAAGTDFIQNTGTLVFPAGTTTQTVNLTVNGDVLDEDDETFTLTLSNAVNAKITDSVGVAKIIDDDNPPELSVSNASAVEGNTGTSQIFVPVSLSSASGRKIKAQISTTDVTATANQDYQPVSETVFFNPGEVSKNVAVTIIPDYRVEPDEIFNVNLTEPVNVNLADPQATGTILNDDVGGIIQFSISNVSVSEAAGNVSVTVSRTGGNASDVAVTYATADGTATAGSDYQATSGNVTYGANESSKTITVPIINDVLNEDTETFSLNLQDVSGGGMLGTQTSFVVSIEDNDPLPRLNVSGLSVAEGNNGTTIISLNVNLLGPSGRNVSVGFATQNGTAIAPSDYLSSSGSVNFAPGETSKVVQLSIVGDQIAEPDETFSLNLSTPVNAVINGGSAIITIINDDFASNQPKFDFDGDGKADVSVYRPAGGWYVLNSSNSSFSGTQFGISTDKLATADFDGDWKTDISVFRDGYWYRLNSSDGQFVAVLFGQAGDIPVPGDYDGDGKADQAVFRQGNWYILGSQVGFYSVAFGISTDKAVPADFDGDGKTDPAVFRDGNWYVLGSQAGFYAVQFGQAGDKPVQADFDGDGKAEPAVFRQGSWYILGSQAGFSSVAFGNATDAPAPADYDGDGKADPAVFRDGVWYLLQSTSGFTAVQFGSAGDKAVPAAYVP